MESPTAASRPTSAWQHSLPSWDPEPVTIASLKESLGLQGERTFLDYQKFHYGPLVVEYFEGKVSPAHDPELFLIVMQAVLAKTEPTSVVENKGTERARVSRKLELKNEFNAEVRSKFRELYIENQELLLQTESPVHRIVNEERSDGGLIESRAMHRPRITLYEDAVLQYLNSEEVVLITKYIAEEDAVSPAESTETAEEFYHLYLAVIKLCPEALPRHESLLASMTVVPSVKESLRGQFDAIYAKNSQSFGKLWDEEWVIAVEAAKQMPFHPQIDRQPTAYYSDTSRLGAMPPRKTPTARSPVHLRSGGVGGGGSGWDPAKIVLLVFAAYLTYRFVAKPAYQWYRSNKPASLVE
ncbi:MAG: hypothetical protein KFB93_00025 [Simkaniaceae bacterium]|nr:MAG: hypothetical protein KFB93_00025 [Simkaniaceae bacterium]